ncbi:hypothetical protein GCM10010106_13510 [Thermopolyspora flexuosa]|uniref:DUF4115 domain-containing protein n=1 Tax=Thermopolyspora flexuosa TaxID=103836 RepID=A0A543IQ38_9ACTN|nr:hypothetical protein FHX40_4831 [Thermopolyspora flexuosa]GGM68691.1 hypothetical protein GCM10010106_13510 [Thermopolyspora flexuosa]
MGAAVCALLGIVAVGVFALIASLDSGDPGPDRAASAAATTPAGEPGADGAGQGPSGRGGDAVPTVVIECLEENCPVFLRIPGGDVLVDRELRAGETATYYEPRIHVVLYDAGSVRVVVNGEERERGAKGERRTFTVSRPTPSPSPSG